MKFKAEKAIIFTQKHGLQLFINVLTPITLQLGMDRLHYILQKSMDGITSARRSWMLLHVCSPVCLIVCRWIRFCFLTSGAFDDSLPIWYTSHDPWWGNVLQLFVWNSKMNFNQLWIVQFWLSLVFMCWVCCWLLACLFYTSTSLLSCWYPYIGLLCMI